MRTSSRIRGLLVVALTLATYNHGLTAAPQTGPGGHAVIKGGSKIKPPAPPPVMDPVKWLPDPIESPLKSGNIPLQCTESQAASIRDVPVNLPYLLDCWLDAYPIIANAVSWQIGGYAVVSWKNWPEERKAALRQAFHDAVVWHDNGLTDYPGYTFAEPIENMEAPYVDQQPVVRTVLDEDGQAWPLYLATTGHILAVEIFGWVPWSIRSLSVEDLWRLMSGYNLFYRDANNNTSYDTVYPGFGVWGYSTPAHPAYTYKFLVDNNLIGSTQTETIERVVDWARWNLWHYGGVLSWDNAFHTWGYYGNPPVSGVIEGTVLTHPYYVNGDHPWSKEPHHWTAGCYGSVAFLANVLRLANIPVQVKSSFALTDGHTMPYFPTIQRYLSHGDDPYTKESLGFAPFPARQLLIDQTMWNDWFVNVTVQQRMHNVGRRPIELSIFFPARAVLDLYCSDQANLLSHADGKIAQFYENFFTVAELESMLTWQRLDYAVKLHGCPI
jgi:hypothetical protein